MNTSIVNLGTPQSAQGAYIAPRRLCHDKDGRVVEANDPTRVGLLIPQGGAIPRARAIELGLIEPDAPAPVTPIVSDPAPVVSDPAPQTSDPTPTAPVPTRRTK